MVLSLNFRFNEWHLTLSGEDETVWITCSGPLLVEGTQTTCLVDFVKSFSSYFQCPVFGILDEDYSDSEWVYGTPAADEKWAEPKPIRVSPSYKCF